MTQNAIGTWVPDGRGGYALKGTKTMKTFVRNQRGMFARDYSQQAIYFLLATTVVLTVLVIIGTGRLMSIEAHNEALKKEVIASNQKGYNMVLDATLKQIAAVAQSNADINSKLFDMTSGSVGLTENLKDQINTAKKLNIIK